MRAEIRRRELLTVLASTGATWPLAAWSQQQSTRVRRIGGLMGLANDAETQARLAAFESGLQDLGWKIGRDLLMEYRFARGDTELMKRFATELVNQQADVILAHSTPVNGVLLQTTRTIPIV